MFRITKKMLNETGKLSVSANWMSNGQFVVLKNRIDPKSFPDGMSEGALAQTLNPRIEVSYDASMEVFLQSATQGSLTPVTRTPFVRQGVRVFIDQKANRCIGVSEMYVQAFLFSTLYVGAGWLLLSSEIAPTVGMAAITPAKVDTYNEGPWWRWPSNPMQSVLVGLP